MLTLTLLFIFHLSSLSLHVIVSTYHHPSFPLSHPPILSPSIHSLLLPMWTRHSDLYLSGMDESQVRFKCPNYSPELWCPALGDVAPSLRLSYESWHGATEPFTGARIRARSHERFSPCTRPWKADHMELLRPALIYPCCTSCLMQHHSLILEIKVGCNQQHLIWRINMKWNMSAHLFEIA